MIVVEYEVSSIVVSIVVEGNRRNKLNLSSPARVRFDIVANLSGESVC